MARTKVPTVLAIALLVGGCTFMSHTLFPSSVDNKPQAQPASSHAAPPPPEPRPRQQSGSAQTGSRRPFVVIRFDRPDVDYEQALYNAVSRALERRPGASFDLVAVEPSPGSSAQAAPGTNTARRDAELVLRSLLTMGLPASRLTLSASTSDDARTNEVHLYVR